jgi:hypothetical protein
MNFRAELEAVLEVMSSTSASHIASEGFILFEGAELHICINMERINIERRNNEKSKHFICTTLPSDSQNTPQRRLQITVHSVRRPRAVDIAFEVLACVNSHIHMGHGNLASLLSS